MKAIDIQQLGSVCGGRLGPGNTLRACQLFKAMPGPLSLKTTDCNELAGSVRANQAQT